MEKRSWSKEAEHRRKNKKWLKYSSNIARRILAAIEDKKDFNQARLAKALGVSSQQISKIVQGKENLTLETIANLSTALNTELIEFPDYKDSFTFLQTEANIENLIQANFKFENIFFGYKAQIAKVKATATTDKEQKFNQENLKEYFKRA